MSGLVDWCTRTIIEGFMSIFKHGMIPAAFLGDVIRYTVRLPGGATTILEAGEPVRLGFLPGDAVVLAGDG